jgi:serine protease Do
MTVATPAIQTLSQAVADLVAALRPSVVTVRAAGYGSGAGVIWDTDGLIVTNAHVATQDRTQVVLADGRALPATLVARDPARDLAALRVPERGLPAAPLGDSTRLRVGQLVFAIGHPLGEPHAAALGIVSAVGHVVRVAGQRFDREMIQADLGLYPGNSGGPLCDAAGRVIGINTMVVLPRLALAIPSATVAAFLAPGRRARLGLRAQQVRLPAPLARRLGQPGGRALHVQAVLPGQPAAAAGLQPGDLLLAIDTVPLTSAEALASHLEARVGQPVRLRVLRDGRLYEVSVTVQGET